mgnify:CR=1 FL=1
MSASALICLAPGSEEMEAVTTIDLMVRGGIKVTTASVASDGSLAITCSRGVKLLADAPRRASMRKALQELAVVDSASRICDIILNLAKTHKS